MPPAIIAAGIAAAGTVGGAAIASRSANKATDAQTKAAADTLAFTREQEAQRKAIYDQKMAQYTAMRDTLAKRYGIDIGMPSAAVASAEPKKDTSKADAAYALINALHGGNVSRDKFDAWQAQQAGQSGQSATPWNKPGVAALPGGTTAQVVPSPGTTIGGLLQNRQAPPDLESWNRPDYGLPTA